jgi:hypothetical protein
VDPDVGPMCRAHTSCENGEDRFFKIWIKIECNTQKKLYGVISFGQSSLKVIFLNFSSQLLDKIYSKT